MSDDPAATADPPAGATPPATPDPPKDPPAGEPGEAKDEQLRPEGVRALDEWKQRARKAEKEAKEQAERLDKIEQANKTEAERAVDKARKEARKEAETEFETERRGDRLQVAVANHARELADVDLTVLALRQGDTDELFDSDGKVKADALKEALGTLLKDKPHLKATGVGKPAGSADGGEGEGGGGSTFNDEIRAQRQR